MSQILATSIPPGVRRCRSLFCGALLLVAFPLAPVDAQEGDAVTAPAPADGASFEEKQRALDRALSARIRGNAELAKLQGRIDEIADETDSVSAQYRTAQKQIEAIDKFNAQMRALIDSQQSELDSVADQLDRVEEVGRNVTPLMLRMIDALEVFVKLDLPFLREERIERIATLRRLMDRADISSATKFRQIMEAYQTENEFGRTIEAYRGAIDLDGTETTVDLLRFGRIALVFQSLDGTTTGVWSKQAGDWERLDASYGPRVRYGLRIARSLEPPDLIELPLPPPEPSGGIATEPEVARLEPPAPAAEVTP